MRKSEVGWREKGEGEGVMGIQSVGGDATVYRALRNACLVLERYECLSMFKMVVRQALNEREG